MSRSQSLTRTPLNRSDTPPARSSRAKRRAIATCSPAQREKITGKPCIVCGDHPTDPAHLASRAHGGCDSPDCVTAICREHHRVFDEGRLDILGDLLAHGAVAEVQHALGHYRGDMPGLLQRLTGERWATAREARP